MVFTNTKNEVLKHLILVVGAPRSGTSCLTASLKQLAAGGIDIGSSVTREKSAHNPIGSYEPIGIKNLHNIALHRLGFDWRCPPDVPQYLNNFEQKTLVKLLQQERFGMGEGAEETPLLVKDPKTIFFLRSWLPLAEKVSVVGTIRCPQGFAASLWKRERMPVQRARKIWRDFATLFTEEQRERHFPVVSFDWDQEVYQSAVYDIACRLNLAPNDRRAVFDKNLRNHDRTNQSEVRADSVDEVYKTLADLANIPYEQCSYDIKKPDSEIIISSPEDAEAETFARILNNPKLMTSRHYRRFLKKNRDESEQPLLSLYLKFFHVSRRWRSPQPYDLISGRGGENARSGSWRRLIAARLKQNVG